jgi:hypothetical protein
VARERNLTGTRPLPRFSPRGGRGAAAAAAYEGREKELGFCLPTAGWTRLRTNEFYPGVWAGINRKNSGGAGRGKRAGGAGQNVSARAPKI